MEPLNLEPESHLAEFPGELRRTLADEAVQHRVAPAAVVTGAAGTLVALNLAMRAYETHRALTAITSRTLLEAGEKEDQVKTHAS